MKNQPSNRASFDCTARTQRSVSVCIPVCMRPGWCTRRARAGENPTSTYGEAARDVRVGNPPDPGAGR